MTSLALESLADKFWLNLWIVKFWFEQGFFSDDISWAKFLEEKNNLIKTQPFIRWAWGKRQMLKDLIPYLPNSINNYYEPFLWSGTMYFFLKDHKSIKWKAYLWDLNDELINTFNVLKNQLVELTEILEDYKKKNSKEFYYEIRSLDRKDNFKEISDIKRAARFIYLNKTCFNGIWRVNSKWQNNVPFWKNINPSFFNKENFQACNSLMNNKTIIKHSRFEDLVKTAKKWDFVFLDPPYDPLTETSNFTGYNWFEFWKEMQREVAEIFDILDKKWCNVLMTNHATPFIKELYWDYINKYGEHIIQVQRYINCKWELRKQVGEIIIKNY